MLDSVFKDYGIVGKVGSEFVQEEVYKLGRAIAYYFVKHSDSVQSIVIARNNQANSEFIEQELAQAFVDSGLSVIFLGLCPIPVMFFSLHTLPVQAGIMITDFNLGDDYNGIKICFNKEIINNDKIQNICELYKTKKWSRTDSLGNCKEYPKVQRYIEWMANQFQELKDFELNCVFDLGFASASFVIPKLMEKLNFKNINFVNCLPIDNLSQGDLDSNNSLNRIQLKEALRLQKAQLGVFFNNDGDSLFAMTNTGKLILSDELSSLFAQDILHEHPSLQSIDEFFLSNNQGHFNFKDRYFGYDDGIYAMLRLLALLKKNKKTIDQMLIDFPNIYNTSNIEIGYATDLNSNLATEGEGSGSKQKSVKLSRNKRDAGASKGNVV